MIDSLVAIDSNSFSFLVDTMNFVQKPKGALAKQKISLFRIYLYLGRLFLTPTGFSEYQQIKNELLKEKHENIYLFLLEDVPPVDPSLIESRIRYYAPFHPGEKNKKDCKILAEAELGECEYLLTYDFKFLSHLKDKTIAIKLIKPHDFWKLLNIPRGSKPKVIPDQENPHSGETWWIW